MGSDPISFHGDVVSHWRRCRSVIAVLRTITSSHTRGSPPRKLSSDRKAFTNDSCTMSSASWSLRTNQRAKLYAARKCGHRVSSKYLVLSCNDRPRTSQRREHPTRFAGRPHFPDNDEPASDEATASIMTPCTVILFPASQP